MFTQVLYPKFFTRIVALSAFLLAGGTLTACDNALDKLAPPIDEPDQHASAKSSSSSKKTSKSSSSTTSKGSSSSKEATGGSGDQGSEDEGSDVSSNPLCLKNPVWCGVEDILTTRPGLTNTEITSIYSDADNKGSTIINWSVSPEEPDYIDKMVHTLGGIYVDYYLMAGVWVYDPYVGVQLNISGWSNEGSPVLANMTDWGGLCVIYSSTLPVNLEIGYPDITEIAINYTNHYVALPATNGEITTRCVEWSYFMQPSYATPSQRIDLSTTLTSVTRVKLKTQAKSGTSGNLGIMSIGKFVDNATPTNIYKPDVIYPTPTYPNPYPIYTPIVTPSSASYCTICSERAMWYGEMYQAETGYDDGDWTSGYWFTYNDKENGGNSNITFPVPLGNEYDARAFDPVIDHCYGICGVANMGSDYKYPYVSLSFNIAGEAGYANISKESGICISYESEVPFNLMLVPAEPLKTESDGNYPYVSMPISEGTTECLPFGKFKPESGWGTPIGIGMAIMRAKAIDIQFKGRSGTSGEFNIRAVDWIRE